MSMEIRRVELETDRFSPKVLKSYLFTQGMEYPKGFKLPERYVYDYELEFFVQSDGGMVIGDTYYPISKGDIVFRRPGQYTQAVMPYCCYMICFDLTGTSGKSSFAYDFEADNEFQDYYINPVLDVIPDVFHPGSGEKFLNLFDEVMRAFINPSEASSMLLKAYTLQILQLLYQEVQNPLANPVNKATAHNMMIKRVVEYIRNNASEPLSLKTLGEIAGLSPNHFHKVFRETMGLTPNEFVTRIRLEQAKELLVKSVVPVYEVAMGCGFENIPYFSYVFKKQTGSSPAEFRKRHSYI